MILKTFQLIKGLGPKTENKLWEAGFRDWYDVLKNSRPTGIPVSKYDMLKTFLTELHEIYSNRDYLTLNELVPKKVKWRMIPELLGQIAYLDIETTGLYWPESCITTIAVYDGNNTYNFIRGKNLNEFPEFISKFPAIATYYGKCFDIPFIKNEMKIKFPQVHFDLCFLLRRLGLTGGLKKVEKRLRIFRNDLEEVDGYVAVILWHKYRRTKDPRYLETLLAYNTEDVINLEYMLYYAYNGLIRRENLPFKPLKFPKKDIDRPYKVHKEILRDVLRSFY